MKKNILRFFACVMVTLLMTATTVFAEAKPTNDKNAFSLVHWNILKAMYTINEYIYEHRITERDLIPGSVFTKMIVETYTPDSYNALFNQDTKALLHPNKALIGKKLADVKGSEEALKIIKQAIKQNTCSRGFYIWTDKEEKYMVTCPLIGKTKDGDRLFYVYTMYTRSMPDYYLKTLKSSSLE